MALELLPVTFGVVSPTCAILQKTERYAELAPLLKASTRLVHPDMASDAEPLCPITQICKSPACQPLGRPGVNVTEDPCDSDPDSLYTIAIYLFLVL